MMRPSDSVLGATSGRPSEAIVLRIYSKEEGATPLMAGQVQAPVMDSFSLHGGKASRGGRPTDIVRGGGDPADGGTGASPSHGFI